MKKNVMNANASVAEAKVQERMNAFYEVFNLESSQHEAAKIAIDYAVEEVVDPDNHEDAVLGTAFDFLSGYEYARNTRNKSVNYMEIVEEANAIIEKVSKMPKEIYGAILAAKSNKKAHITRDQVIKTQLDKMMTV